MSEWCKTETWGGDVSYDSPLLTYDGAVSIASHPEDIEGAALTLILKPDAASVGAVQLTIDEARELRRRLLTAIEETELAALRGPSGPLSVPPQNESGLRPRNPDDPKGA